MHAHAYHTHYYGEEILTLERAQGLKRVCREVYEGFNEMHVAQVMHTYTAISRAIHM
jgi:hypothetical protein